MSARCRNPKPRRTRNAPLRATANGSSAAIRPSRRTVTACRATITRRWAVSLASSSKSRQPQDSSEKLATLVLTLSEPGFYFSVKRITGLRRTLVFRGTVVMMPHGRRRPGRHAGQVLGNDDGIELLVGGLRQAVPRLILPEQGDAEIAAHGQSLAVRA